ncbi:MAG: hypothetical protein HYY49_07700 [Ignavibacteriales bacterium]|nr:hypothetical protein [Ignavibacteriales bacterium]
MIRRSLIILLSITASLGLVGCSAARYGASIDKPAKQFTVVRHVKFEDKGGWVFFGAASVNSVSFEPELRDAMQNAGGDEVMNVVVTSVQNADDIAITVLCLFGIVYSTRTFTVEADIIAYK